MCGEGGCKQEMTDVGRQMRCKCRQQGWGAGGGTSVSRDFHAITGGRHGDFQHLKPPEGNCGLGSLPCVARGFPTRGQPLDRGGGVEQEDPGSALGQLVERMLGEKGCRDSHERESSHDVVKAPPSDAGEREPAFRIARQAGALGLNPEGSGRFHLCSAPDLKRARALGLNIRQGNRYVVGSG